MQNITKKALLATAVAVALGSQANVVLAQEESAEDGELERILVSAQRRTQSIQEVPVAVTAISPEDMELKQVTNVRDLQYQVPNISIATNTGTASGARVFLRGVGEDESRVSADPAVGIYVDGVYIGRQVGAMFDLVDLERIEVLRGPQGTLYGRNSNGGAIKLVSRAPQMEESSLDVRVGLGSESAFDTKLTGNVALGENTALRGTYLHKSRDGFHTLNPTGDFADQAGKNVGEVDVDAFRIAVLHQFDNDWKINLAYDMTDDNSDPVPDSAAPPNDVDNDLFTIEPLPGADPCSAFVPAAFLSMGCFTDYRSSVDTQGLTLNISGPLSEQYDLAFLTGWREMEDDLNSRIGFAYNQQTEQEQLSQEITLTSNLDGNFNYVTGLYYFNEDVQMDSIFIFPFALGIETDAWAVFAQGDYQFGEDWTLSGGVRYTDESKEIDAANLAFELTRAEKQDFSNVTYSLALNKQFSQQVMGYASYATGFKSGGWSPDCFGGAACFLPVEEEELDTIEIGVKSDLLDNTLRLNATYFFNMYDNLQIAGTVPGLGFTRFNVAETEISGLELEMVYQVSESFSIDAMLGTLDAEYKKLTEAQAAALTNQGATPGCNGTPSVECALALDLKNAPDYKFSLGLTYVASLASGELTSRIDFAWEEESWNLVANDPPHALTDPGTQINARIAYEPESGDWMAAVWGRNLSDEEYARAASAGSFTQYAANPLEWGVEFEYRF